MSKPTVLDLFSGAGGLSLGFKWAGFKVIGAIDFFKDAIETLRNNHPEMAPESIICGDITQLTPKKASNFFSKEIDVIVGGPPCQGMSLAGKRLSKDSRNFLFLSFIEYVKYFKPKFFLMENVPGLLSMDNGKIKDAILNTFLEIKYNNFENAVPAIINSAYYGVPQIRERLFFLGSRKKIKIGFPPKPTHSETLDARQSMFAFTEDGLPNFITVKEALSDLPPLQSGMGADEMPYLKKPPITKLTEYQKYMRDGSNAIYNHESPKHTDKLLSMIKKAHDRKAYGQSVDPKYSDSKMWDPDKPSFTIKALGQGGGSTNRRAFHYRDIRGSTVRENARIQSFPDKYRFFGPKTNQMTQVGNAVPPLLAQAIANAILQSLIKY
jgi:DNA (cytosine-5)-methyltransferase 1|tara:strand:+ start:151 stop:1293 length:1143 start_codon:yes stop_codon:yes gene_type:complete